MTKKDNRRSFLTKAGIISAGTLAASKISFAKRITDMIHPSILNIESLSSPWKTQDPFIFCAYHNDKYPGGNESFGPNVSLKGRNIGSDFSNKDGWSMYHGEKVPGFPVHPHSGFETVTIVNKGLADHSDSLGAFGRFGNGDVQWMTAGKGIQHSEMFPLLNKTSNHLELFQIWLNLPEKSKKVDPHYKMLWNNDIPIINITDINGKETEVKIIAGNLKDAFAVQPTPNSWAADTDNLVQIWTIKIPTQGSFKIELEKSDVTRSLFFYSGDSVLINSTEVNVNHLIELDSNHSIEIENVGSDAYFLFLQGKPINEPVVNYGPFVATSQAALRETMQVYQQTNFGGWPWESSEPVHGSEIIRFSQLKDGRRVEK